MLFSVAQACRNAWSAALLERGLSAPDDRFESGGYVIPQAKVAARALLHAVTASPRSSPGPTRWPSAPWLQGIAVPHELSVAGVDGHDWSPAYGLTTVEQDLRAQVATAAKILLAAPDGAPMPGREDLTPRGELVIRRTTAAAPDTPSR